MRYIVSVSLVIVALIHIGPIVGVFGNARLAALYGIDISDPNLSILMRHRAVLFGILGAFQLFAAFAPACQAAAIVGGFVSLGSFLYLAWSVGGYNANIGRVFAIDVFAFVCLIVGAVAHTYIRTRD